MKFDSLVEGNIYVYELCLVRYLGPSYKLDKHSNVCFKVIKQLGGILDPFAEKYPPVYAFDPEDLYGIRELTEEEKLELL